MEAPLHRDDRPLSETAEQKTAGMALDGGQGEARDLLVGDGGLDLDPTPNTITIDVTPVNDAPNGADAAARAPTVGRR